MNEAMEKHISGADPDQTVVVLLTLLEAMPSSDCSRYFEILAHYRPSNPQVRRLLASAVTNNLPLRDWPSWAVAEEVKQHMADDQPDGLIEDIMQSLESNRPGCLEFAEVRVGALNEDTTLNVAQRKKWFGQTWPLALAGTVLTSLLATAFYLIPTGRPATAVQALEPTPAVMAAVATPWQAQNVESKDGMSPLVFRHTVAEGETLYSIARSWNLTPESILLSNPELASSPTLLQIGDILLLPKVDGFVYRMQEGENIAELSDRFNVSTEWVIERNGISDPRTIRTGTLLVFPIPNSDFSRTG